MLLHWLILFWEKKLGHQILQILSYEIRKYFFRNRSTWRHFYSQISQTESGNQMLPYQWQKLIVKEIFVKPQRRFEDLKVNKLRRIFLFFLPFNHLRKFAEYIFVIGFYKVERKVKFNFLFSVVLILMISLNKQSIFNLIEKMRNYLQFFFWKL